MSPVFVFDEARFNRLFPFYILINRELRVSAAGNSIQKLCAIGKGDDFKKHFSIPRPNSPVNTFNELLELQNQLVVIDHISGNKKLRGQFEYLDDAGEILFIGSPWFGSMEQVREHNLQITDFAHHDPLIDLLHVLKAQEINNDDLKKLVATFNEQKQELKKANREIHDIALFPTQNPDPLIRINFDGDVLLNNPAASLLDFFEYEGNLLRNDIFFKIIADHIDHDAPRWVIEARSGNRVYSFLCVTMKEEGYINIYGRDITEKKKINDQLARLSLVARANKNGVLFTSPLGYITWANEGFCNMTGYTLDEVIGKSPVELCQGPLTDENTLAALLDSFFKGKGFNTDIIYYKKDRSWFWGHSFSQPLRDEQGNITEFFGIIQDVTAEKASAEKMKVLSQIAEDNINAVVIADKEGKITWANKSFTTMTGYSLEEATGKKPGHLLQGAETDKKTVQYLAAQIAKGEPFNTEILNYKKNGQKYWLRIQGQPIKNEKGAITGYFALEEDITKEKESEDRFRKALEHIGDNVWEHDFRTGTTYFSKSENQFLGYSKEELANNQELWWNSVHADDRHLLEESNHKYKNGKANAHNLEYRMVLKDGSIRWVLDRGVVIEQDITGKPLRITGTHTDITNSKHTEAELANRVKQFQSLSENIPGVIYEFAFKKDGTDGLRYISPAIEKLFGIKPEDFINYLQYIHPADRETILQKNLHSRQTLTAFYAEARLTVPGQPERWLSVHSSFSYRTGEGDDVFTGFMLDITQRKNAEQELEEQRKFYEDVLNNMPADIAVFSASHEYLFVNPRGIKDDELRKWIIGKRDEDYCRFRNKPLSIAEGRRATFNKVVAAKKPSEWEEKMIRPDGSEEYILRRWFPVMDNNGNIALVIGYGLDITERKKFEEALKANEEKYRGIIANMNLGLMEMDQNGRIDFANQTLLNMTGLSGEEAVGYDAMNFLAKESREEVQQRMQKRSTGVSEAYEVKTSIGNNPGWWLVSSAPKYTSAGEHSGSIVICLDITNQKNLEQELIRSREQAETLAKTKETFLANMSHEIRTPMNAIIGMGNQLAKTALNRQQHFYLGTINTAAENLLVIINDILDLSKIEAGKLTIERIGFEPKKVVGNAMQVLMHKAEEKGLRFTNSFCDSRLSEILIGDPYRLNQVMLNLISNAIKFTEKGSVDVTCEVIKESETTQTLKCSVTDTGIGMEQKFVEKLFDKFSQEYESVTRKYGGTGLGMGICKELVGLMGGQIEVTSEKGKGTTIQFVIEFAIGARADLPASHSTVVTNNFLQGKTILVTDDNEMNRLVASIILQNYGAEIVEAGNGEQAVQTVINKKPDLVLMDIQMPVMNGYEAAKQLRKLGYMLPVIALTANASRGENEKCLSAGMNDYISKPFREDDLLKMIAQWLNTELVITQKTGGQQHDNSKPAVLFDLSSLQAISQGKEEFVHKMLRLFIEQAPATLTEIKQAYAHEEWEKVKKLAHRLKPSIDSLGIHSIKNEIREIEKNAPAYGRSNQLNSLIGLVETVVQQVTGELKNYLNNQQA